MMKKYKFIPDNFEPPVKVLGGNFIVRQLLPSDTEVDYKAFMSSIGLIRRIRGGDWPTSDFTLEDNRLDLIWKLREWEYRCSFSYAVFNPDETEYLGCIYFYPPEKPWLESPEGTDVVVNMWVTQEAYDKNFYPTLFKFVTNWVEKDWPFKNVYYSNKEIPKGV